MKIFDELHTPSLHTADEGVLILLRNKIKIHLSFTEKKRFTQILYNYKNNFWKKKR